MYFNAEQLSDLEKAKYVGMGTLLNLTGRETEEHIYDIITARAAKESNDASSDHYAVPPKLKQSAADYGYGAPPRLKNKRSTDMELTLRETEGDLSPTPQKGSL